MSGASKAPARPKCTEHQTARKQLQKLQDATAEATKQLRFAQEQLAEATSFIFVCLQALRPGGDVDATEEILIVMGAAYVKLIEDVKPNVAAPLRGLGVDGAE